MKKIKEIQEEIWSEIKYNKEFHGEVAPGIIEEEDELNTTEVFGFTAG
jgi:hypothetical protein